MADCKKYNGSTWQHSLRKLTTATDTITTLPADIFPNATTATVGLKGQAVQSTTPTPQNPVMPNGTGERTENLWSEDYTGIRPSIKYVPILVGDGTFTLSSTTPLLPNGAACLFFFAGNADSGAGPQNRVYDENPITLNSIDGYVTIAYRMTSYDPRDYQTMLNTGSTPLPYEPYGYKIPISSANTTTPVYLGEVETTRKIKKLVLTGEENWFLEYTDNFLLNAIIDDAEPITLVICTHQQSITTGYVIDTDVENVRISQTKKLNFRTRTIPHNLSDFKAFLQQQYAAGMPVTVWYILATPETAVVNEPLMKIGDYADEVSNVSIPVTAGGDTISVGTTVQPSEVTVDYKGWHPVQSVHEKSRNLFDKTNETIGAYMLSDGTIAYAQSYSLTDYISINEGSSYTISAVTNQSSAAYHCFYTKDKVFISSIYCEQTSRTFTTPVNAKYIRCSYRIASNPDIMLNEGSTALPYEPYWN